MLPSKRTRLKDYRALQRTISGSFLIYARLHHVGIFLKLPSPRNDTTSTFAKVSGPKPTRRNRFHSSVTTASPFASGGSHREVIRSMLPAEILNAS